MNVHNIHAHHIVVTWTCNICNRKLWPNFFSNKKVHGYQKLMRHTDAEILESVHEVQWSSITCMLIMLLMTWTCNICNYKLWPIFSTIRRYMAVKAMRHTVVKSLNLFTVEWDQSAYGDCELHWEKPETILWESCVILKKRPDYQK